MAVAAIRRDGETNERMISRWKKKAQQSGIVTNVRGTLAFSKRPNTTSLKKRALVREGFRAQKKKNQFYV